ALSPAMGVGSALAFCAYGAIRYRDARVILRYRRNIRRLPRYVRVHPRFHGHLQEGRLRP
ncbi:hypothetical protein H0484_14935, partial [Pusillimonas sp. CC-YST705]